MPKPAGLVNNGPLGVTVLQHALHTVYYMSTGHPSVIKAMVQVHVSYGSKGPSVLVRVPGKSLPGSLLVLQ